MSAKSFLSKIFGSKSNKNKLKDISAQKALLLQKDYIDNLSKRKSELFTPPFMEIAKQLSSEKQEIFRAWRIEIVENLCPCFGTGRLWGRLHGRGQKRHPSGNRDERI